MQTAVWCSRWQTTAWVCRKGLIRRPTAMSVCAWCASSARRWTPSSCSTHRALVCVSKSLYRCPTADAVAMAARFMTQEESLEQLERRIAEANVRLAHAHAAIAELRQRKIPIDAATKAVLSLEEALGAMNEYRGLLVDVGRVNQAFE